jgi:hypothetical protein
MDFAEGRSLKYLRKVEVEEFVAVLCDQGFRQAVGKILAADAFCGKPGSYVRGLQSIRIPRRSG